VEIGFSIRGRAVFGREKEMDMVPFVEKGEAACYANF
jgi:hypothetical protein